MDANFDTVRWVRSQFTEDIESAIKESEDIFIPESKSNSMASLDIGNTINEEGRSGKNKNIIACKQTASTKEAQNDKLARILAKCQVHRVWFYFLFKMCTFSMIQ